MGRIDSIYAFESFVCEAAKARIKPAILQLLNSCNS
jgi:hypothetical protein